MPRPADAGEQAKALTGAEIFVSTIGNFIVDALPSPRPSGEAAHRVEIRLWFVGQDLAGLGQELRGDMGCAPARFVGRDWIQWRYARRLGIRVVYVSTQPLTA